MRNTITQDQIERLMDDAIYRVETVFGKVTIVSCKLKNGFVITESSGAVDPANYSEDIGAQICIERIKNRLWELEGYCLQKKLAGGFE